MNELFPEPEPKFDVGNNKEYKVEAIIDSAIYTKEAKTHLPDLYYLIFWKSYLEEKSTWKLFFIIMHLRKMISMFHKDHLKKPTATSSLFNSAPSMAKPSVKPAKPSAKQKQGCLTGTMKRAKKWDIGQWDFSFSILVRLKGFFTNFVSFGKDAHLVLFSNSVGFLSMSSILPLCLLSISSTLLLCSLSMSDTLPLVF